MIVPPPPDVQSQARPNRAPCTIWATRRDFKGCYVKTVEDDRIQIAWPIGNDLTRAIDMPRHEARMLAKRINECLDATVIR